MTKILFTSQPCRSLNPCSSREMPPMTATVRTPRSLPNLIASSSICCASSLVGARIIAYGPSSASSNLHSQHTSVRLPAHITSQNVTLTEFHIEVVRQNRIHEATYFQLSTTPTTTSTAAAAWCDVPCHERTMSCVYSITAGRLKLQDWTLTNQRKCKGGHCRAGHCRTGFPGVDNDGRPTDWRNSACYRCCGSVGR